MKTNTWYKATPTYPTPRTVYTQQVFEASKYGDLRMQIKGKYCYFFDVQILGNLIADSIYSCTRATAKKKFKFEQL
jgi:hypothetical protein